MLIRTDVIPSRWSIRSGQVFDIALLVRRLAEQVGTER
jgi:hypothetical protein